VSGLGLTKTYGAAFAVGANLAGALKLPTAVPRILFPVNLTETAVGMKVTALIDVFAAFKLAAGAVPSAFVIKQKGGWYAMLLADSAFE